MLTDLKVEKVSHGSELSLDIKNEYVFNITRFIIFQYFNIILNINFSRLLNVL